MTESRLQHMFRNEVHLEIDVMHIDRDRYAIFVPNELTGGVESRIVLWRDMYGKWWFTDERYTFRHESRMGSTIFSGVEIRLEVREDVSGGDLKHFMSALEKLGSHKKKGE